MVVAPRGLVYDTLPGIVSLLFESDLEREIRLGFGSVGLGSNEKL